MIWWWVQMAALGVPLALLAIRVVTAAPSRPRPRPHPLDGFEVPGLAAYNVRTWYDSARSRFMGSDDEGATAEFEEALGHLFDARGPLGFDGRVLPGVYAPNERGGFRLVEECQACGAQTSWRGAWRAL